MNACPAMFDSDSVADMCAVPIPAAFTTADAPLGMTVAILVLDVDHVHVVPEVRTTLLSASIADAVSVTEPFCVLPKMSVLSGATTTFVIVVPMVKLISVLASG